VAKDQVAWSALIAFTSHGRDRHNHRGKPWPPASHLRSSPRLA